VLYRSGKAFDADFFGIHPGRRSALDPQHRILLEVSWEALEQRESHRRVLQATQTGIFLGIGQNEYAQLVANGDLNKVDTYVGTGNGTLFLLPGGCLTRWAFKGLVSPSIRLVRPLSSVPIWLPESPAR